MKENICVTRQKKLNIPSDDGAKRRLKKIDKFDVHIVIYLIKAFSSARIRCYCTISRQKQYSCGLD